VHERVAACSDIATINQWFDRAIDAKTIDEVFAE
jgi:4-hydroxybenzoate polyprenyltransferase